MIGFDGSQLVRLAKMLTEAEAITVGGAVEVRRSAEQVAAEARATAGTYPHGTGALAADINVEGDGLDARIYTNQREGFYLEVGTPNTGAPRPWLTGPADDETDDLGNALAKLGALW